jgi:hypothetical protein
MDENENLTAQDDADDDFPTPRRRVSPMAIAGVIVLIALVISGGIFAALRPGSSQGGTTVAVVPTLVPGSNLFYVQTTPTWGSIAIDGHTIAHLPDPAVNAPIELPAGPHQVVWHADPFQPQECTIIVPPIVSETPCLTNDLIPVTIGKNKGLSAYVITFSLSLANLPDAQRSALINTAQAMLDKLSSLETVLPGERFVNLQSSNFIEIATSMLHARPRYQIDANPHSNVGCYQAGDNFVLSNCVVSVENCHLFCNTVFERSPVPARFWDIYAPVQVTWTYTTLSGQIVAQNQPDVPSVTQPEYLEELFITWDGTHWQVTDNAQGNAAGFLAGDANCTAGVSNVDQSNSFSETSLPENPNLAVNWSGNAGSDGGAGCLLVGMPQASNLTPVPHPEVMALCLYRFGVLLAVNNVARSTWPQLPVADANEQSIAQQIASQTHSS